CRQSWNSSKKMYTQDVLRTVAVDAVSALTSIDMRIDRFGNAFVAWTNAADDGRVSLCGASYRNYSFVPLGQFSLPGRAGRRTDASLAIDGVSAHYYVTWTEENEEGRRIYFCRNTIPMAGTEESKIMYASSGGVLKTTQPDIAGAAIEVPAEAIVTPKKISVSRVVFPPESAHSVCMVGNAVDFGPGGLLFKKEVTLKLPCRPEDIAAAGIEDLSVLRPYYFNLATMQWEEMSGGVLLSADGVLAVPTRHLSMYMVGAPVGLSETPVRQPSPPDAAPPTAGPTSNPADSETQSSSARYSCFIATAAYGTALAPQVRILCRFRDEWLLKRAWGKVIVGIYYRWSPAVARQIERQAVLAAVTRIFLNPLVFIARNCAGE
ncbi:MAG: hypothetical protein NC924_00700, partial [Candidatus Omnitrophica bacterium]|nr:hypothetical protein [Candidatus Omnitrophota bacterium]